MSIQVTDSSHVSLYDSVTGLAFGPTFEDEEQALDYLRFCTEQGPLARPQDFSTAYHKRLYDHWFNLRIDGTTGEIVLPAR